MCNINRKKSGFTLIELIVVIAILGILALFLVPSFLGYAKDAKEAVCRANMTNIVREYEASAAHNSPASMQDANKLLADIYASHKAEDKDGSTFYTGGSYSGICSEDGIYGNMISDDFAVLTIRCTIHGDGIIDIKELKERLEAINFDDIKQANANFRYKDLNEYFQQPQNRSLDSEAISTDPKAYGDYGSLANAVTAKLKAQGIDTTGRSWRMYRAKDDSEYNLFLTDTKITVEDANSNTWITCTKYEVNEKKVIYGKVQVSISSVGDKKYPVINGGSFKADNN